MSKRPVGLLSPARQPAASTFRLTFAPNAAFHSVASQFSATHQLVNSHPGNTEPHQYVGDLLNGLGNSRRQFVLLPRVAPQIK
jgi:hypothetical protein